MVSTLLFGLLRSPFYIGHSVSAVRDRGDPGPRRDPVIVGLERHAELAVEHPQITVVAARNCLRRDRLDFLRYHADIGLVAAVVAEAIETQAIIEVAEKGDVVLEQDVGTSPTAPTSTTAASAAATAEAAATAAAEAAATARETAASTAPTEAPAAPGRPARDAGPSGAAGRSSPCPGPFAASARAFGAARGSGPCAGSI